MINIDELFDAIEEGRKGKNIGMSTGIPLFLKISISTLSYNRN